MKTAWKAALGVLAFAGATAATPAAAQSFGLGFGPQGGISFSYDSGGYCDQWGCPDDFWDMPLYYGPVFWGGEWYDGPVYYRDWYGRRQFWLHGDWRFDEWRGPHPNWWREGRFGPALGENFYRSNGFHGRWDGGFGQRNDRRDFGGPDQRRDFGQRDDRQGFGQRDDRQNSGPRNDRQGFGQGPRDDRQNFGQRNNGGFNNRSPQPQQAPQPQAQPGGRDFGGRGAPDRRDESGPRNNGGLNFQGRAMNRQPPAPQAAPQPAPQAPSGGRAGRGGFQQQAAPQQNASPGKDDGGRRGRDRDNH